MGRELVRSQKTQRGYECISCSHWQRINSSNGVQEGAIPGFVPYRFGRTGVSASEAILFTLGLSPKESGVSMSVAQDVTISNLYFVPACTYKEYIFTLIVIRC